MTPIKFVECQPPEPVLGPPCPGPSIHTWSLAIEEGRMSLTSGCGECDDGVLSPVGGEDVEMAALTGKLIVHVERSGYYDPEYTCWWEFVPGDGSEATP